MSESPKTDASTHTTPPVFQIPATQFVRDATLHINTRQAIIVVTEDKVRLCLHHHIERMNKQQAWITPASLVITLGLTLVTTTFNETFGLPAATWEAIAIMGLVASAIWLARCLWYVGRLTTMEDIVGELRQETQNSTGSPPA